MGKLNKGQQINPQIPHEKRQWMIKQKFDCLPSYRTSGEQTFSNINKNTCWKQIVKSPHIYV